MCNILLFISFFDESVAEHALSLTNQLRFLLHLQAVLFLGTTKAEDVCILHPPWLPFFFSFCIARSCDISKNGKAYYIALYLLSGETTELLSSGLRILDKALKLVIGAPRAGPTERRADNCGDIAASIEEFFFLSNCEVLCGTPPDLLHD